MLNAAICDDCPMQTEIIQILLDKYQAERPDIELCTHSFTSGKELLDCVDSKRRFDLFLLDILMPEKSGIEYARDLRARDADVPLIFLTSSSDYTLEAFDVWAAQYILKPVTEAKLFPILDKIIASIKLREKRFFVLTTPKRIVNIPFSSIDYVELVGRTIQVNQSNGQTLTSNTIRTSFAEAVASLLEDMRFFRPHNSFVINMSHVKALSRVSFTMKNGEQVPIPRPKYAGAKDKYLSFLSKMNNEINDNQPLGG